MGIKENVTHLGGGEREREKREKRKRKRKRRKTREILLGNDVHTGLSSPEAAKVMQRACDQHSPIVPIDAPVLQTPACACVQVLLLGPLASLLAHAVRGVGAVSAFQRRHNTSIAALVGCLCARTHKNTYKAT